jgi:hypothetical protein
VLVHSLERGRKPIAPALRHAEEVHPPADA